MCAGVWHVYARTGVFALALGTAASLPILLNIAFVLTITLACRYTFVLPLRLGIVHLHSCRLQFALDDTKNVL